MGPQPKPKKVVARHKRQKPSASTLTSTTACKRRSHIWLRRLWCSSAPRTQHPWQVSTKANANTADATELQRLYSLLSQIYRRNKNQHRGQGWWKFFQMLRRGTGRLVRFEEELGRSTGNDGSVRAEDVRRQLEREKGLEVQKREVEGFVRETLIGRCCLAFSTVVQDSQFAALGVVLMGVLASIGKEVGLPRVEVEKIRGVSLRQTGVDRGEVVRREYSSPRPTREDAEEVVERSMIVAREKEDRMENEVWRMKSAEGKQDVGEDANASATVDMDTAASSKSTAKRKDIRKKKGKKSVIDELFASLI